jgi:hypothetical protein
MQREGGNSLADARRIPMLMPRLAVSSLICWLALSAASQQKDPASLPARDAHENFLAAAEVVADAARSKEIFGKKHPHAAGLLAVQLYFKNDNDQAISVDMDRVRLLLAPPGGSRQRLQILPLEDAITMMAHPQPPNPNASRKPRPFPIPRSGESRSKDWKKVAEIVRPLALEMDIIPPRATVHGYIFFDLDGKFHLVPHASLYIPDLKFTQTGQALLFFEIPLAAK